MSDHEHPSSNFLIRPAEPCDIGEIVRLVRALAEFENLPGPDEAGAARLAEHAFGERPCFETLLAESEGSAVGLALYFMTYSTFAARPSLYLEDLFVLPSHRRRGIGQALLERLASVAVARDCGRFEWTVLDWNASAQRFYQSLGARVLSDWRICRIDQRDVMIRLASGSSPERG